MKLIGIVGSIRKDSYNKKLAKFIQSKYKVDFDLELLPLNNIPMYNQDDENNEPKEVSNLKEKIENADGVIIITPEYNYSVSGVLKNTLDWLSRGKAPIVNKPLLILGASMGIFGSVRAQGHLRDILLAPTLKARVYQDSEFYLGAAHQQFDDNGDLKEAKTVEFLDSTIKNFQKTIK